jgi:hypothetical protein
MTVIATFTIGVGVGCIVATLVWAWFLQDTYR